MEKVIYIGGVYTLGFAVFHLLFWKLFGWKSELGSLNRVNRGIMQILNLRLTYVFAAFACLSFVYATELPATGLGRFVLFAAAVFWLLRAVEQVIFFGLKDTISLLLFFIFLGGAAIYFYSLT